MKTLNSEWAVDSATGDLYENGQHVGKLITGNPGGYLRLIEQANKAICNCPRCVELRDNQRRAICNCEICAPWAYKI